MTRVVFDTKIFSFKLYLWQWLEKQCNLKKKYCCLDSLDGCSSGAQNPRTPELQPSTPREPFLIVLPSNKCWHSDYLSVPKTMLGCKVNHFMYSRVATLCFCIAVIQTLWFYAVSICRRCRMHCCPLKIPANLEPIYEPWMILFGETASHLSLQKHYIQSQRGANAKRQKSVMWVRSHGLVCRTLQPLTSHFSVVARLFCCILKHICMPSVWL